MLSLSRYIHCRRLGSGSCLVSSTCELFLSSQVSFAQPEPILEPPLARVLLVPEVGQLGPRRSVALIVGVLSDEAHDGQGPLLHPPVVAPLNDLLALAVSLTKGLLRDPGGEVQREDPTTAGI